MDIILLQDITTLGYKDEVVTVKNGYARNFLIPQGMALVANKANTKSLEERKKQQSLKFEKMMDELKAVAKKLEDAAIKIGAKTGTSGKIFGSVTTHQIADAIKKAVDHTVDRRKIKMMSDVKMVGEYQAEVELHRELKVEVTFEVIGE